jgi:hypothetical protein
MGEQVFNKLIFNLFARKKEILVVQPPDSVPIGVPIPLFPYPVPRIALPKMVKKNRPCQEGRMVVHDVCKIYFFNNLTVVRCWPWVICTR